MQGTVEMLQVRLFELVMEQGEHSVTQVCAHELLVCVLTSCAGGVRDPRSRV